MTYNGKLKAKKIKEKMDNLALFFIKSGPLSNFYSKKRIFKDFLLYKFK